MSLLNFLTLVLVFLFATTAEATICTGVDNRVASKVKAVGRVSNNPQSPCSVTLISKACAVTAGHCASLFGDVEFNTPPSDKNDGKVRLSKREDTYPVVDYVASYLGNDDFAVLQLGKNKKTNKLPGQVQGYADVDFHYFIRPGDLLQITGYGTSRRKAINHAQASHYGRVHDFDLSRQKLTYHVDTTGGSSGSALFDMQTNKIIGVHTNGGCGPRTNSANFGSLLSLNQPFKSAIRKCLAAEGENPFKFD